ncbi:MAG: recombinase family protein [Ktedonobacteraceae bacterium]|nr:recombinase family protein [Ktedonobacteraceae bacterium]
MKKVSRVEARLARGEKVRVIIYCRVSTDDQEDNGTSLDTQRQECRQWAEQKGYIVIDVVPETFSGFKLEERVKFQAVRQRAKDNECDAILFRTYDRLSRNRVHYMVIQYDAQRYGYELLCAKEVFDENNIYERMLRDIISLFAEFEVYKIRERTTLGKKERAKEGKLINGKRPRYGYAYADAEHTHYKAIEEEVKIINRVDALYLEGHSMQGIATILTNDDILTPTGNKIWTQQTINDILTCTEYHQEGYSYMHETYTNEKGGKSVLIKPVEERIKMPPEIYPLIRTKETYDAIQERRKNAHSMALTSSVPEDVLLRGLIRCSMCGGTMTPGLKKGKGLFYRCSNSITNSRDTKHNIQIVAHRVEKDVNTYVTSMLEDISKVEHALKTYIDTHTSQESVESYDNAITQIKEQQKELTEDLRHTRGHAKELLLNDINKMEDEIDKIEEKKSGVMGDGQKWEVVKQEVEAVIEWIHTGDIDFEHADMKEKRRILRVLGISVLVFSEPGSRPVYEIHAKMGMSTLATTPARCSYEAIKICLRVCKTAAKGELNNMRCGTPKCPIASGKACNIVNMNDTIRYNKANAHFLYLNDSR